MASGITSDDVAAIIDGAPSLPRQRPSVKVGAIASQLATQGKLPQPHSPRDTETNASDVLGVLLADVERFEVVDGRWTIRLPTPTPKPEAEAEARSRSPKLG